MSKVLMVPDAFLGEDSGAVAARGAARVWKELGCDVEVYAMTPGSTSIHEHDGIPLHPRPQSRSTGHVAGGEDLATFNRVLAQARPSHVFFLGTSISKPAGFFRSCRSRGIGTIGFWWTQDFFCARFYGCLPDGPCTRCLDGSYVNAFIHKCSYANRSGRVPRLVLSSLSRSLLKPELRACDATLGSTDLQLEYLRRWGVPSDRLVSCPLFFDRSRIESVDSRRGDYFVCHAQSRFEKGWHLLRDVISGTREARFLLPFPTEEQARTAVDRFGLRELVAEGRVHLPSGMIWKTGVGQIVARSRGVVLPSIWPTTTEFTLLESLGLGKPVVTFDVGIHHETLVHGENALVAPVGDTAKMSANLEALWRDDDLCLRLEEGSRAAFARLTEPEAYRAAFRQALKLAS